MDDLLINEKYIYKYVPFNLNTIKLLTKGELFFGPLRDLNDPFEGDFIIKNIKKYNNPRFIKDYILKRSSLTEDEFDIIINTSNIFSYFESLVYQDFNKKIKNDFGVSCFSKNPFVTLMWSHYADNHTGLCLIFDKEELLKSINYTSKGIKCVEFKKGVNYVDEIQDVNIEFNQFLDVLVPLKVLEIKRSFWNYEEEVRFIKYYRINTFKRFVQFYKNSLKGVIFGVKIKQDDLNTLVDYFNEISHYRRVRLFRCSYDTKSPYGFNIFEGIPEEYYKRLRIDFYPFEIEELKGDPPTLNKE